MKTAIKDFAKFYIGKKEVNYKEFMDGVYRMNSKKKVNNLKFNKNKFHKYV